MQVMVTLEKVRSLEKKLTLTEVAAVLLLPFVR